MMKVRPDTVELDDDQRREIARYWDTINGEPWDADGDVDESKERLADYQECWQYIDNLLDGYLDDERIRQSCEEVS